MTVDWDAVSALGSWVSAIAAGYGVFLLVRAERRQSDNETPLLEGEFVGGDNGESAFGLRIVSRSKQRWRIEAIEVASPMGATLALSDDLHTVDGYGAQTIPIPEPERSAKFVQERRMGWILPPIGTTAGGSHPSGASFYITVTTRSAAISQPVRLLVSFAALDNPDRVVPKPLTLRRTTDG